MDRCSGWDFQIWAILELIDKEPEVWRSFSWYVFVLKRTPSLERLREMKRRHDVARLLENSNEISLIKEFNSMWDAYVRLIPGKNSEMSSIDFEHKYDGGLHKSASAIVYKFWTAM